MPTFSVEIATHGGATEAVLENPTGLSWTYQTGANGPGKASWSIAEFDDDVLGLLDGVDTMPKKRDFRVMMDGFPLIAGPLDSVNMPLSSNEIHFTGLDWLHWLEQDWREYYGTPMDYVDNIDAVIATDAANEFFVSFPPGSTLQDWIEAILTPLSVNASEQIILSPLYLGDAFSQPLEGEWERNSGMTALTLLQNLAAMDSPYGFDFYVATNKELNMYGPRKTDPLAVFPIATFTQDSTSFLGEDFDECAIVDGDWTNNGPIGTDILFRDGIGNAMRYFRKQHQDSVDEFRQWGASTTIGGPSPYTAGTDTQLEFKAAAASYRMMFPQRQLTLTVKPELFSFNNMLLEPIAVDYRKFTGSFRRINAEFWITGQTYRESEPGSNDWLCDLTLDQIYIPIS